MEFVFFLRSYGDFMVGLYALKHKPNHSYTLIASSHLEPLYKALEETVDWPLPSVTFVELGIRKGLLAAFTNKFLFTSQAYNELSLLRSYIQALKRKQPTAKFCVEQFRRRKLLSLFTGVKFGAIHTDAVKNIYDSYMQFFRDGEHTTEIAEQKQVTKFIIFPDSRLVKKQLPINFTEALVQKARMANTEGKIAYFNQSYKNFDELIALIKNTKMIFSADSLPAHIAQYFDVPHKIYYKERINKEWVTPYALQHNTVFTFNAGKES
jgi:hypothetical protein